MTLEKDGTCTLLRSETDKTGAKPTVRTVEYRGQWIIKCYLLSNGKPGDRYLRFTVESTDGSRVVGVWHVEPITNRD